MRGTVFATTHHYTPPLHGCCLRNCAHLYDTAPALGARQAGRDGRDGVLP